MNAAICARVAGGLALLVAAAACGPAEPPQPALTPVTVQLTWFHQADSAGLYAADQNGDYAAEGLRVALVPGGPAVDRLAPLLAGTAQFATMGADEALIARAQGKPVRVVATVFRRSPIVFVVPAESGIRRPQDFAGKTIRTAANVTPTLHAVAARVGLRPGQYAEVTLPSDVELFRAGKADVWTVYVTGLAVTLERAGHPLRLIYPDDYGVHFYADSIVTTDETIRTKPDLVRRFLRAALKGWTYAVENAARVGPMVVKYKPDADADLETAKLAALLPLVNTGEDHIGWMKPEVWAGMERTLREQGVLTTPLDVSQVYTLEFLREIYGEGGS